MVEFGRILSFKPGEGDSRSRRRRKFYICVNAYVIDPFGAAAQKSRTEKNDKNLKVSKKQRRKERKKVRKKERKKERKKTSIENSSLKAVSGQQYPCLA